MQKVYTIHQPDEPIFEILQKNLTDHLIKLIPLDLGIPRGEPSLSKIIGECGDENLNHNIIFCHGTYIVVVKNKKNYVLYGPTIKHSLSQYILKFHKYPLSKLSVRKHAKNILGSYIYSESPNFSISPAPWIEENAFYKILKPKPFYDRLLAFNLDKRGLFLKVWTLRAQHNYFHPSVNSGLPLTKKKDEIHEGTFMMHDMFHHIFLDPIVTYNETPEEKNVYIAARMMSEACTLVLADMMAVAHSGIESLGYDINRRKIYPLFKSLKLDPFDIETVRKLMYANSTYSLFGDSTVYEAMGAEKNALDIYKGKYYKFFSGDFEWNEKNINNMSKIAEQYKGLKKYFDILDDDYKVFNTKSLAEKIRKKDGKLSFAKLFEVFWEQLAELIHYKNQSNPMTYIKTSLIKYISGQLYIACKYDYLNKAKILISRYPEVIKNIKSKKSVAEIFADASVYIEEMNEFIEILGIRNILLPHEVAVCKLHVPHFPPEYVDYDRGDEHYATLPEISARIMAPYFAHEPLEYKKISQKLKNYYLKIVNT